MKYKIIYLISLLFIAQVSFSQTATNDSLLVNKKGIAILPQKGDIAVGLTAGPILQYVGNFFFNSVLNPSPDANKAMAFSPDSMNVMVKYMLRDDLAARVTFGWNTSRITDRFYVRDDAAFYANPLSNVLAQDIHKTINKSIKLAVGLEQRRGKGKLQGYYGADLFYEKKDTANYMTYANPISEINQAPSAYNYMTKGVENMAIRPIEKMEVRSHSFGTNLFLGTEYFFYPGMAIGSEVSWELKYTKYNQVYQINEYWDGTQSAQRAEISSGNLARSNQYTSGLNNLRFGIFLMFYF
jgi:hypothetical protein